MRRHRRVVFAFVALGVFVAMALVAGTGLYSVVEDGSKLPYEAHVYEVRVADLATVYVDADGASKTDAVVGIALTAAATVAFMTWWFLGQGVGTARRRGFWLVAGVGFMLLALDELAAVHETIGHNLLFLRSLPGVDHPDDLVLALYALPATAAAIHYRDVLLEHRRAALLLGLGAALFPLAAAGDVAHLPAEELAEIAASVLLLAGILALARPALPAPSPADRRRRERDAPTLTPSGPVPQNAATQQPPHRRASARA